MHAIVSPAPGFPFANTYAGLPDRFFARLAPVPVSTPRLIKFNYALALQLGIDPARLNLGDDELAAIFAGNVQPAGADPIAMAYAGHQFGHFVPRLGDGRAILLGEVIDHGGIRRDIQLKGSGQTPFSRGGDGRAALGPVLREYVVSEAMHALGIAATRALAAVLTGENILRQEGEVPGAVFTRVAASHVRVGTFQYFSARADVDGVKRLADYVLERHYPAVQSADHPYLELLRAVCERQAKLVASWMHVGFIHGVMNTDNMTVSGETIDFGPCAFMDEYDPSTVFSSIDSMGRYAYANQPMAAQWNLARLAETLLPLIDADSKRAIEAAGEVITAFPARFEAYWLEGMRAKLGFFSAEPQDNELVDGWLMLLQQNHCDFTLAHRRLCDVAELPGAGTDEALRAVLNNGGGYEDWSARWRSRLARELQSPAERAAAMRGVNPAFIPRNHRIAQLIAAALGGNFAPFEEMLRVLSRPYEAQPPYAAYEAPPAPDERVLQTFCGT